MDIWVCREVVMWECQSCTGTFSVLKCCQRGSRSMEAALSRQGDWILADCTVFHNKWSTKVKNAQYGSMYLYFSSISLL